jgi:hypothetical protein
MGYSYTIVFERWLEDCWWEEIESESGVGSGHSSVNRYFYSNLHKASFVGTWYIFSGEDIVKDYSGVDWKNALKTMIDESQTVEEVVDKITNGEFLPPHWEELEKWALKILNHPGETLRVRYEIKV